MPLRSRLSVFMKVLLLSTMKLLFQMMIRKLSRHLVTSKMKCSKLELLIWEHQFSKLNQLLLL
jgi:hypothetical protein